MAKNIGCNSSGFEITDRISEDMSYTEFEDFVTKCRREAKYFTRTRKMPLANLLKSIIFRKGRSLKIELREFEEQFNMEQISAAGYLKQRMKLNPEALKDLAQYHARQFYNGNSVRTLKGYLVCAGDGCILNAPAESSFTSVLRKEVKARPQVPLQCMFDVFNRVIVDLDIYTQRVYEAEAAIGQL